MFSSGLAFGNQELGPMLPSTQVYVFAEHSTNGCITLSTDRAIHMTLVVIPTATYSTGPD